MEQDLLYGLTRVVREATSWIVQVPAKDGRTLEYICRTRRKARYMAAIFKLGPTWCPEPNRIREPGEANQMIQVARLPERTNPPRVELVAAG